MGNFSSPYMMPIDTTGFTQIKLNLDSPFYGQISIWRSNNTQQMLAICNQNLYDEVAYIYAINESEKQSIFNHQSLVKLYYVQYQKTDVMCTTVYQMSLLYEYISYSLMDDMRMRQDHYIESELWYILQSVLSGLSYLNLNQVQGGNIRPHSILINYLGNVKIPYKTCFSNIQTSYQEAFEGVKDTQIYLSPELMRNLKSGNLIPQQDLYKSDIFTLALSVLECCTPLIGLNDMINFQINYQVIEEALSLISNKYSEHLIKFLRIMLEFNENRRFDSNTLTNLMDELRIAKLIDISDKIYIEGLQTQYNQLSTIVKVEESLPTIPFITDESSEQIIMRHRKRSQNFQIDIATARSVDNPFPYKNGDLIDGRNKITHIKPIVRLPEKVPIKFVYKKSDLNKFKNLQ